MVLSDTLSNCEGCLLRPTEANLHPTLRRVGDSLGEATVLVKRLAN